MYNVRLAKACIADAKKREFNLVEVEQLQLSFNRRLPPVSTVNAINSAQMPVEMEKAMSRDRYP